MSAFQNNIRYIPALTAFGESLNTGLTPVTQISAQYGELNKIERVERNGGTNGTEFETNLFFASSGTSAQSFSRINAEKHIVYHSGQGAEARITAMFDDPVEGNIQFAGIFTATDALGFGYNINAKFGFVHANYGVTEARSLTITTGAAGPETAVVTIDGVVFNCPITAGTAARNAYEIAEYISINLTWGVCTSNQNVVTFVSYISGPRLGAFSFSSASAVASWSTVIAGVETEQKWYYQEEWNNNKAPWLDKKYLNVFRVEFQYLGAGFLRGYIENQEDGYFDLVHQVKYPNRHTRASFSNPSFRVGWVSDNYTAQQDVTVKGASAAGFIQGEKVYLSPPRGYQNTEAGVGSADYVGILHLRCRTFINNRENMAEILLKFLSISTDSTKGASFQIRTGATSAEPLIFSYVNETASIAEVADNGGVVTGGDILSTFSTVAGGPLPPIQLDDLKQFIHPDEVITICAKVISGGTTAECTAALTWTEDV